MAVLYIWPSSVAPEVSGVPRAVTFDSNQRGCDLQSGASGQTASLVVLLAVLSDLH